MPRPRRRTASSTTPSAWPSTKRSPANTPDILHFYKRDGEPFPTDDEIALAERPGKQRSLLFYNWKPSTTLTWRQVADGGADADIDRVASG